MRSHPLSRVIRHHRLLYVLCQFCFLFLFPFLFLSISCQQRFGIIATSYALRLRHLSIHNGYLTSYILHLNADSVLLLKSSSVNSSSGVKIGAAATRVPCGCSSNPIGVFCQLLYDYQSSSTIECTGCGYSAGTVRRLDWPPQLPRINRVRAYKKG